jgi:DNA-binding MarR family transcriptional regulator
MNNAFFVIKGKLRKEVLAALQEKPKTGKRLSAELNKHLTSVSRALIELEERKLVKCINPKDDRFRFYQVTAKGRQVLKKIAEMEK